MKDDASRGYPTDFETLESNHRPREGRVSEGGDNRRYLKWGSFGQRRGWGRVMDEGPPGMTVSTGIRKETLDIVPSLFYGIYFYGPALPVEVPRDGPRRGT